MFTSNDFLCSDRGRQTVFLSTWLHFAPQNCLKKDYWERNGTWGLQLQQNAICSLLTFPLWPNKCTDKTRVDPARIHARFSRKTNMRDVFVVSKRKLLVQLMNFRFKILSKAGCNMNKNGRYMKSYMKAISVGNFALIRRSQNVPGQAHAGYLWTWCYSSWHRQASEGRQKVGVRCNALAYVEKRTFTDQELYYSAWFCACLVNTSNR